jgi:hypothetical protein
VFPALDSNLAARVASLGTLMGTGIITLTALSSAPGRLSLPPLSPLLHRALDTAVVHALGDAAAAAVVGMRTLTLTAHAKLGLRSSSATRLPEATSAPFQAADGKDCLLPSEPCASILHTATGSRGPL